MCLEFWKTMPGSFFRNYCDTTLVSSQSHDHKLPSFRLRRSTISSLTIPQVGYLRSELQHHNPQSLHRVHKGLNSIYSAMVVKTTPNTDFHSLGGCMMAVCMHECCHPFLPCLAFVAKRCWVLEHPIHESCRDESQECHQNLQDISRLSIDFEGIGDSSHPLVQNCSMATWRLKIMIIR